MKHVRLSELRGGTANPAEEIRGHIFNVLGLLDEVVENSPRRSADGEISEAFVRAALKVRRSRERHFDSNLFADPAWDILLELYAAELGQQRVSVSSLCIGAAVPPTTALRWIKALEAKGMIARTPDPTDARRVFVSITPDARDAMDQFFRSVPRGALLS